MNFHWLKAFVLILVFYVFSAATQINNTGKLTIKKLVNLSKEVEETSGLLVFDNRLITHNDSGGEASLYEIDITSGAVNRKVNIRNAKNKDMEDIAQDENYIYLCDIGNNLGNRKDQVIYKISKEDYLSKEEVEAERIEISYKEQTDYSKSNYKTNFDAEAVVDIRGKLFLFTKNWGNGETSVYEIPKEAGKHELQKIDTYQIGGLITGADYNPKTKTVVLTGYANYKPMLVILKGFSKSNPLSGEVVKLNISLSAATQIEGVAAKLDGTYYISAESSNKSPAVLYSMSMN